MADYQQGRSGMPRQSENGHSSNYQRDAAFSNIFGAAPPPGRSQTMTSSSPPSAFMVADRTHTMSSQVSGVQGGHRQPQPRPQQHMYPTQSPPGNMPNGRESSNGYYERERARPVQHSQMPPHQQQQQQQQQYMHQQSRPNPRPYPTAQRVDPRAPPPQQQYSRLPPSQRYYTPSGPAMNSDPYRTQSLASITRPQIYQPPPNTFNQAPANAFRQAPYQPHSARTTAQGRIVPERHDERAMSMTSYPQHQDSQQTMSGRIIPNRRISASQPQELPTNGYSNQIVKGPATQTRTSTMSSTTVGDASRTMSMASTIAPTDLDSQQRNSLTKSVEGGNHPRRSKAPLVYPALLSRVGECFREKIVVGDRTKNDLTYKNAFSGAEAVDVISYIIKTTDRNLALLLGRALDAQKFFHDVTYDHRLRDSPTEMYQFRETMMDEPHEGPEVNGVFVLLSECYSPTCTRDQLCYSIACPRRLEQQSRLNLKPQPGLRREKSQSSLHDADEPDEQKLWINTVSQEIANSVSEREKKRQEVISEIMYTERDFVKDLEYLRDFWIVPLRSTNPAAPSPIPESRKERIVRTIFSNIIDPPSIHGVSSRFADALTQRQRAQPVVKCVGDIFLEFVPQFEPFIVYGSNQLSGKFEFENERSLNPYFSKFVDETERRKESRKLELNGYLTKPTTRLARYPLLLENVLKYTEPDSADKEDIPKAMKMIRELLTRVNAESGKAENRFNLKRLHEQLRFRPNERVDLKLTDEGRELLYKGPLKKTPTDPADIQAYLFDHAVLLVRVKTVGKKEEYKVYRRPIPLELLTIREMEEVSPQVGAIKRPSSSLIPGNKANSNDSSKKDGFPITFRHLGKGGYELTLYAGTPGARKKWMDHIGEQQAILRKRGDFYNRSILSDSFFTAANRVNCLAPFDGGRKLIYGTDTGIYVSDRRSSSGKPVRVLDATNVTQIDVLEEYQLLLVLSQKSLLSYPLSALNPNEPALSKRPKKIQSHCNFFKTGICMGRHLVCCVKSSALSTTIKVFEPNDAMSKGKKQNGFKMFKGGQDELKAFKEFYIPTESSSIHFLKTKLCVACARGFEVVSLETLETQSLLDQADTSLDFVARKEGVRPIHIERLNGEFLLNYSEFSFFVNRNGWRARPDWRIDWEGLPQSFALSYPWILAFEPNFIEIRNIDTNAVHIVPHRNIRMLHTSTREIIYAYEDERGEDVVAAIDFWPAGRRPESTLPPAHTDGRDQHPQTHARH
ncbi:hypothetical protein B7463_g5972, partial [Scytalidium lignicola]